MRSSHKVVLITGASSGIGRATALAFSRRGASLVLAARREGRLAEVATEAARLGGSALAVRCDVTRPEEVRELMARAGRAFGGLDVLVNNAGLGLYGPLEQCTDEQVERVFAVNFFGLARVTREALPLLRRKTRAQIINVSSVVGHRGLPMLSGYCASKAAVNALTESLRAELAPEGLDVLLVSPGLTESEFREARLYPQGYQQEKVPFRAVSAESVGEAIVRASRTRRRTTVLTLAGRAMVYANRVSPWLMDKVARRMVGGPAGEGEA
ncbi:MAG: SDR family oxidoreductase [Myxococcales bacterium]|nr:SDR family oxidoreductase [Myxococcales bacterium]